MACERGDWQEHAVLSHAVPCHPGWGHAHESQASSMVQPSLA